MTYWCAHCLTTHIGPCVRAFGIGKESRAMDNTRECNCYDPWNCTVQPPGVLCRIWTKRERENAERADGAESKLNTLRSALRDIRDVYDMRSEIFVSDADCAGNLADRAREALRDE